MKYDIEVTDLNKSDLDSIMSYKPLSIISLVLMILEGLLSVSFGVMVWDFNVLPFKYLIVLAGVILVLFAGIFFLRWKGNIRRIISSIISLLLCFVFAVGNYYIYITNRTIDTITGEGYSIVIYKVAVKADDPAEDLKDAAGYRFGTIQAYAPDTFDQAVGMLEDEAKAGLNLNDYAGIDKILEAWYAGDVDGMIYESTIGGIFDDLNEDYYLDSKIIAEVSIKIPKSELPAKNDTALETESSSDDETDSQAETETESTTAASVKESIDEPFVIFISGNDEYNEVSITGRSDVNMVVVVNFTNRQVLLVSIPRDYYVEFPDITNGSRDKLTHAGIYGMDVLTSSVEELLDVNIDYYVRVNFTSVVDIIDAIGGLAFYNPYPFGTTYYDYYFDEGEVWVDGWQALQYARERKSLPDGDFARGQHQQIIIEAMINKLVSAASLANYTALMDAIDSCAITDMPKDLIKKIVRLQLNEGGSWNVLKAQVYGTEDFKPSYASGGMELSVVIPDQESVDFVASVIKRVYNGDILTEDDLIFDHSEEEATETTSEEGTDHE